MKFIFKKGILTISLSIFFLSGFSQEKLLVTGSIGDLKDGDKIYLIGTAKDDIDSVLVKYGVFEFANLEKEKSGIYFISSRTAKRRYDFPVFLQPNSKLNFRVDSNLIDNEISGDLPAIEQNEFYQERKILFKDYNLIQKQIETSKDNADLLALKVASSISFKKANDYTANWVMKHLSSPFSAAIIRLYLSNNSRFGVRDTIAEKYYDALLPSAKMNNRESEILLAAFNLYSNKYLFQLNEGFLPTFNVEDTSRNKIDFSAFKDDYLLIDFWASWCAPCRENNPVLRELYSEYKGKGLTILSISFDKEMDKWKAAIVKDNMQWLQGSDLKGQDDGLGTLFNISSVPIYILVDKDRKIILKSIGGDVKLVRAKLEELIM